MKSTVLIGVECDTRTPSAIKMHSTLHACHSIDQLRQAAQVRLPRGIFDFYDGGADDECTLADNRAAFRRTRLVPRVLRDVSSVDLTTTLFGEPLRMPLAIAPTGGVGFGWRGGDVAIAQAATSFGIPYTLSTSATASIEDVAAQAPGRRWFQAYVLQDKARLAALIERARAMEYEALMITVDLAVGGKRERDFVNGLTFPMKLTRRNIWQFVAKPRWSLDMLLHKPPVMPHLVGLAQPPSEGSAVHTPGRHYDPAFDLEQLKSLRDRWPGRLIVKGISHPGDVAPLLDVGVDALVVSNHGGRQLDTTIATLDALPAIAQAVNGRIPVLLDGGIRRGNDIVKALALGASAVMVGRATLYGALAAGHEGACRALWLLQDEFRRTMQLCGLTRIADIRRDLIAS